MSAAVRAFLGRKSIISSFRFCYNLTMDVIFLLGIGVKYYGYEVVLRNDHVVGSLIGDRTKTLPE